MAKKKPTIKLCFICKQSYNDGISCSWCGTNICKKDISRLLNSKDKLSTCRECNEHTVFAALHHEGIPCPDPSDDCINVLWYTHKDNIGDLSGKV